jgi:membrane associated rhomboid family serine protease
VFIFPPLLSIVAFVPAHTYGSHAYFWNLVTYAFVETNVLLFAIDAVVLFIFLPVFERMWGATETTCFFLACVVSAALFLLISLVACFAVTLRWEVLQVCAQLASAHVTPNDSIQTNI